MMAAVQQNETKPSEVLFLLLLTQGGAGNALKHSNSKRVRKSLLLTQGVAGEMAQVPLKMMHLTRALRCC